MRRNTINDKDVSDYIASKKIQRKWAMNHCLTNHPWGEGNTIRI